MTTSPRQFRRTHIDLSPWTRNAAGDISGLRLPSGYRITGHARSGVGPWTLRLHRDGGETLAEHITSTAADVPAYLRALVNLAAIHEHEQAPR